MRRHPLWITSAGRVVHEIAMAMICGAGSATAILIAFSLEIKYIFSEGPDQWIVGVCWCVICARRSDPLCAMASDFQSTGTYATRELGV